MLLHLVKKDILIGKKYVLLVLVISIFIPLFIAWRVPEAPPMLGFLFAVIFAEFMMSQNLSMKETQYAKALAFLCATPYPRRSCVQSKYVMFLLIFIYSTLVYSLETLLAPNIGDFNIEYAFFIFAVISLVYSIYMPIQFLLGYEKTKLFFVVIIMASSFLLPLLIKYTGFNFNSSSKIPEYVVVIILGAVGLAFLWISSVISTYIYNKKGFM